MSQDRLIKLRCGACKQINYNSEKNKKPPPLRSRFRNSAKSVRSTPSTPRRENSLSRTIHATDNRFFRGTGNQHTFGLAGFWVIFHLLGLYAPRRHGP